MELQENEWDKSYRAHDNYLFYPNEEIICFTSKYIRKRIGLDEFLNICSFQSPPRFLDLGCGIGRHVIFGYQMGLDVYGIDLSGEAIQVALELAAQHGVPDCSSRIIQGESTHLPWENEYFDFVVSHGVIDSMNFEIACLTIQEVNRVIKPDGLFYCNLISGDDSNHSKEYCGEEIVTTSHERGTIQSYFNYEKIHRLIQNQFSIVECFLVRKEDVISGGHYSRYHLTLRKL